MPSDEPRSAYAHEAVLIMPHDEDLAAPGAAITERVCDDSEPDPPVPLAPHSTSAERVGEEVHLRTVFVARPRDEDAVRRRIDQALAQGRHGDSRWHLRSVGPSELTDSDRERAQRLHDPS